MFFLSWRQLMARKKQTFLILLGISFGTLLFVSISGVQLGMRQYIAEQLLNNTAHVLIKGAERNIDEEEVSRTFYKDELVKWTTPPSGLREESRLESAAGWYRFLLQDNRVREFSPRLTSHAVLSAGKFTSAVNLTGTIPAKQVRVSSIEKYMRAGSFLDLSGGNKIILGSGVGQDLGVAINDYITVNTGTGVTRALKVVGFLHFGNKQVDSSVAFSSLSDLQILARSPGRVTEIAVALYDSEQAEAVAADWKALTRDSVEDWKESNQQFMEMIKVQDFTRYFITTAILIVACFGIYNVLSIMINQKKREIAILQAIGYGPQKILHLVLYQGIVLGIGGGILGIVLGYLMCLFIGNVDLNIEIGGSHNLIVSYDPHIYVTAFFSAVASSIVAAFIPARSASRMTPMEIIRSE